MTHGLDNGAQGFLCDGTVIGHVFLVSEKGAEHDAAVKIVAAGYGDFASHWDVGLVVERLGALWLGVLNEEGTRTRYVKLNEEGLAARALLRTGSTYRAEI